MIELTTENIPAKTTKYGADSIQLSAGKRIQVRHGVTGDITEMLDEEVPEGKSWLVSVQVNIIETDA